MNSSDPSQERPANYNPPGLTALAYRIGTHPTFFQRLLAGLHTQEFPNRSNFQTPQRPLHSLTTQHLDDPAIALLDAWAVVADVLTFYQERIANEGYLRTATEDRSILELSRTVGYKLNPGVAASTFLAFTVEDAPSSAKEVTVPQGTRVQSIPKEQGQLPQTFETIEEIKTRVEWNSLKPYIHQEFALPKFDQNTTELRLQGINTGLQPGDAILIISVTGGDNTAPLPVSPNPNADALKREFRFFLTLQSVETDAQKNCTLIHWDNNNKQIVPAVSVGATNSFSSNLQVFAFRQQAFLFGYNVPKWNDQSHEGNTEHLGTGSLYSFPLSAGAGEKQEYLVEGNNTVFSHELNVGDTITAANQSRIVSSITDDTLLKVDSRFSPDLPFGTPFTYKRHGTISSKGTVVIGKGTVFSTQLKAGDIITAANESRIVTRVDSDSSLTVEISFSSNLPEGTEFTYSHRSAEWPVFRVQDKQIDLDSLYPKVLLGSWVLLNQSSSAINQPSSQINLYKVKEVSVVFRPDFGLTGKITRIEADKDEGEGLGTFDLRKTIVFAQSEQLELFAEPQPLSPVQGNTIEVEPLIPQLETGRSLIISGKQIKDKKDEQFGSELASVASFVASTKDEQGVEQRPTILTLREPLQYNYDASTVEIRANVALATHGETVEKEVLGSGDGGQANQRFKLKKPPLTYVSAATASGSQNTLQVYVNDVLWREVLSLDNQDARSQCYIVQIDDQGECTIIFGDGIHGSRLPSGQENIIATYRSGTGQVGEVKAGSLILLQNRPLGIRDVTNPQDATGANDRETSERTRDNTPRTVLTLDRIVSLRDFENFSRSFAGIGKAQAVMLWTGQTKQVHITIAGADEKEASPELCTTLHQAIAAMGNLQQSVQIESFNEIEGLFKLTARVFIDPRYQLKKVEIQVRKDLNDAFSFKKREFGQDVAASEVIEIIQKVEGVVAVDLEALYLNSQPKDQPKELKSFLCAQTAYWDWETQQAKPAQLLLLDSDAVALTMEQL